MSDDVIVRPLEKHRTGARTAYIQAPDGPIRQIDISVFVNGTNSLVTLSATKKKRVEGVYDVTGNSILAMPIEAARELAKILSQI